MRDKVDQLADELAAIIAKGSSDYGNKRNQIKRLLVELAREIEQRATTKPNG